MRNWRNWDDILLQHDCLDAAVVLEPLGQIVDKNPHFRRQVTTMRIDRINPGVMHYEFVENGDQLCRFRYLAAQ